jgi:DNA-binding beta-propeller fold protein YncE
MVEPNASERVAKSSTNKALFVVTLAMAFVAAGIASAHRESRVVAEFGGKGTQTGQFSDKTAFYADDSGNLYVVDATYKRIQRIATDGSVSLEISNTTLGDVVFQKPTAITVDAQGVIYVVDLAFVPVEKRVNRPVFTYGHCVRRFNPNGEYLGAFYPFALDLKNPWNESALLGVTPDGELSAIVPFGDTERTIHLAASPSGHLYVNDRDTITELDAEGTVVQTFAARGGREDETHESLSMAVDANGAVYVADRKNDRVVVFDAKGEPVRTFGSSGSGDGELTEPFLVRILSDGTVAVADRAVYTRLHESTLPRREDDPTPEVPETMIPLQKRLSGIRLYPTLVMRVQRFDADGRFVDKQLLRFPVESSESWHYAVRAIDGSGRLYCQHDRSLRVRVYESTKGVQWNRVDRNLSARVDLTTLLQEVDNPDLDAELGLNADFRARGFLFDNKALDFLVPSGAVGASGTVDFRFAYDVNEKLRVGFAPGYYSLRARSESLYQTEAGLDPERSFPQDDQDFTEFDQAQFGVVWERTLSQDPYRYRSFTGFLNFGFGKATTLNDAIAASNLRRYLVEQTFFDWEVGVEYDLGARLYATASVLRGPAYGGYDGWWTYVDETGALFARGFNKGRETRAQFVVEGMF